MSGKGWWWWAGTKKCDRSSSTLPFVWTSKDAFLRPAYIARRIHPRAKVDAYTDFSINPSTSSLLGLHLLFLLRTRSWNLATRGRAVGEKNLQRVQESTDSASTPKTIRLDGPEIITNFSGNSTLGRHDGRCTLRGPGPGPIPPSESE